MSPWLTEISNIIANKQHPRVFRGMFCSVVPLFCFLFEVSIVDKFFVSLLFAARGVGRSCYRAFLNAQIWFPCRMDSFRYHPTRNCCQFHLGRTSWLTIQFHPFVTDFRQRCGSLLTVAFLATRHGIFPCQRPTHRSRNNVVEGQICCMKSIVAILASVLVSQKDVPTRKSRFCQFLGNVIVESNYRGQGYLDI
jgi:hypothetical protein